MPKEIRLAPDLAAIVDDDDFDLVSKYNWRPIRYGKKFYARATVNGETAHLHRFIMGCSKGDGRIVDHVSSDSLDNRRCNLRFADWRGSARNRKPLSGVASRFKGVSRRWHGDSWLATLRIDGKYLLHASYDTEEAAALAYDFYARKHFGEFAYLNFPQRTDTIPPTPRSRTSRRLKNKLGLKGVRQTSANRYAASIGDHGKEKLGYFDTPEDAAMAYDRAALERYGPTTYLNFPDKILPPKDAA